jgi:chemotaxis signal transduction protein
MKLPVGQGHDPAADLRLEFDQAFAAPAAVAPATVDLLAVRVAGAAYALRLSEIGGLRADRRIMPLPGAAPELLGLAGLRGTLAAIYDLAPFLGHDRSESARWVVLAGADRTVGLAFEELAGFLRVAPQALTSEAGPAPARRHVSGVVQVDGALRPLVDVGSILETIRGLARQAGPFEER